MTDGPEVGAAGQEIQPPPGGRVLAVIVAYNSPEALARCLRSLDAQTRPVDGVLVIDNSEPLPASITEIDLPISRRTTMVRAGSNLGPAGGFALGLGWFYEEGLYTRAWLMDDDSYPDPSALEILIDHAASLRRGSAVFPSAVYEATGVAMNYPGWSGVLLDRLAVQLAGLPMAELFWWAEDTEYLQFRLPRKGVLVARADEARVVYDLIRRSGGRPAWKYYYETRNMIWLRLGAQRGTEVRKLPRTLVRLFGSAVTSEGRGDKVRMYGKGLADGIRGRLGSDVRPPPPGGPSGGPGGV